MCRGCLNINKPALKLNMHSSIVTWYYFRGKPSNWMNLCQLVLLHQFHQQIHIESRLTVIEYSGKWLAVWKMWALSETHVMQRERLQINEWTFVLTERQTASFVTVHANETLWQPLILTSVLELLKHVWLFIVYCHVLSNHFSQRTGRCDQMIRAHSCICKTHGHQLTALTICVLSILVLSLQSGDCLQNKLWSVHNFAEILLPRQLLELPSFDKLICCQHLPFLI